jgi:hypothetical protein
LYHFEQLRRFSIALCAGLGKSWEIGGKIGFDGRLIAEPACFPVKQYAFRAV